MNFMCHVCARCFSSAEALRNHIQDERSRLIHDIKALCTKPHHTISSALGILVRYATHSSDLDKDRGNDATNPKSDQKRSASQPTEAHDEQNLACPESFCDYASTNYQLLQRHYMTHVPCDETCLFCKKPLVKASQFVRHPDDCVLRKKMKLEVPMTVKKHQLSIAEEVYKRLRRCQRENRTRRVSSRTKLPGRVEGSTALASPDILRDTDHCRFSPAIFSPEPSRPETSPIATTVAPHHPRSDGGELASNPDNPSHGFGCADSVILPTISSANEIRFRVDNSFLQTSSTVPPASALGNSSDDRIAAYSLGQALTTAGDASPHPSVSLLTDATSQRAPTLSDSLVDGAMIYPPSHHSTEELSSRSLDLFSFGGAITQRAPTLGDSLIDGQITSNSVQRPTEAIPHCPSDPFPILEAGQRAPILSNSLIDGAMACSLSSQCLTMPEGMSSFQPNSALINHALSSDQVWPDSIMESSDAAQQVVRETNSTGERAAALRHFYRIPTSDQSAAIGTIHL